jgi:hypothetical protein
VAIEKSRKLIGEIMDKESKQYVYDTSDVVLTDEERKLFDEGNPWARILVAILRTEKYERLKEEIKSLEEEIKETTNND